MRNYKLLLVILLAAFTRLFFLDKLFSFTSDESYLSYVAQTIIKDFHVIWIGISAGGYGLYYGPYWIYVISPLLALLRGDPLALGILGGILGVFSTILVYYLGNKIVGKKEGFIAALFYSSSALVSFFDQKGYPSGVSLLSLLMLLSIYKAKKNGWWWILFAVSFGGAFHVHMSLLPLGLVGLYFAFLYRKKITKSVVLATIVGFLLMLFPLIAFDYFHKGSNIKTALWLVGTFGQSKGDSATLYHLDSLFKSFGRVWFLTPYRNSADEILYACANSIESSFTNPYWIVSVTFISIFLVFLLNKKTWMNENRRLLALSSLVILLPFIFSKSLNPYEYYLTGFFPILFLASAFVFLQIFKNKSLLYIVVATIVLSNLFTVSTAKGEFGLSAKRSLVKSVMRVIGDSPYELIQEGGCHKYGGWRYVFSVYGKRPERSSEDETYSWLYPNEVSQLPVKYRLVVKETRSGMVQSGYSQLIQVGGFDAYLYDLSKNDTSSPI